MVLVLLLLLSGAVSVGNGTFAATRTHNMYEARKLNREAIDLQSRGQLNDACELYRKAIALHPGGGAYHNNFAVLLKEMGEYEAAEKEARQALALKPARADYHFNLGLILMKRDKNE